MSAPKLRRLLPRFDRLEAPRLILRQRRVYVLPSRAGLAVLLTLGAMLLASINYNLSLGYALVFLLGSVLVVHILHSWRAVVGLELACQVSGESFAGGQARWRLELVNPSGHERAGLRVLGADNRLLAHTHLPASARTTLEIHLPATRRGLQQPGRLSLESRAPLGWIRAWAYFTPDAPALVFPRPEGERPLPSTLLAMTEGQHRSVPAHRPGQEDFAGLRGYRNTDSPRHIAWKQLAQGRGLLTKTYASPAAFECVLDFSALPASMPLEARLSQLCAWVLAARARQARTTLSLPELTLGPGSDGAHHHRCLELLARHAGGARS